VGSGLMINIYFAYRSAQTKRAVAKKYYSSFFLVLALKPFIVEMNLTG